MRNHQGPVKVHNADPMHQFDVTVSYGLSDVSLNDRTNFRMAAEDFGARTVSKRKIESRSVFYDGTYITHSTKENITENLTIYVLGFTQNHVTENLLILETLFDQDTYTIQVRIDDHIETWSCFTADYGIDRGHINMHNGRATFKAIVPRLPQTSYEVVL